MRGMRGERSGVSRDMRSSGSRALDGGHLLEDHRVVLPQVVGEDDCDHFNFQDDQYGDAYHRDHID